MYEPSSDLSQKRKSSRDLENDRSGFFLKDKKSKFFLKSDLRFRSTNFKPSLIEKVSRNCLELSSLSEEKLIILLQVMSNPDEINYYFKNNYQNKIGLFVKAHIKSLHEMEDLKRVQELRVDEFSRRRLIENQDTIDELTARIQELQNEVNCMNDSRDFKDVESARSGPSHVPSQPALLPLYRDPGGLLRRNSQPPEIWNSQGLSGNVFANPPASSSSLCPRGFNPCISNVTEDTPVLTSTGRPVTCCERQISRHSLHSQISARTVSQKFCHP